MRCLEHGQECNYLSVFDPQTIEWYDHFYKNLAAHFTNRIDDVYACILGPYGEGNYPLMVPERVNMGHCHEGYWCGDKFARAAFQKAMHKKYSRIAKLNRAWGTLYKSFDVVTMPAELVNEKFKPSLGSIFLTAQDKRRMGWILFRGITRRSSTSPNAPSKPSSNIFRQTRCASNPVATHVA